MYVCGEGGGGRGTHTFQLLYFPFNNNNKISELIYILEKENNVAFLNK